MVSYQTVTIANDLPVWFSPTNSRAGEVFTWRRNVLKVGTEAPDFELPAVTGDRRHKVRLSEFRGKKIVVLAFYPLDWTPT
jgi:peroxiredoxin